MFEIQKKENIKTKKSMDLETNKSFHEGQISMFSKYELPSLMETQQISKEQNFQKNTFQDKSKNKDEISIFSKKRLPSHTETKNTAKEKVLELKKLSDQNLLLQTKNLVQKERNITIQVLRHLSEIEFRKLYLKRGFSSLFDYAVKELGYSHSSAYRRIKAMKLCRAVPETASKISAGSLNLTTVSQLQTYFEKQDKKSKSGQKDFNLKYPQTVFENTDTAQSEKNKIAPAAECVKIKEETKTDEQGLNFNQKLDLLEKVTGKSSRQTEKLLCESDPEIYQIKDKVRYLNKDQMEIKLSLDKNAYDSLERLKSLLSHKNPNMSYRELFKILLELGLNKHDPERKLNKIKTTKNLFSNIKNKATDQKTHSNKEDNNSKNIKKSRYIPAQIRRVVWTRDKGQCTYICPETKKKCGSKHLIQIDHIHPYSLGGSSELNNLRLLCVGHNQYRNKLFQ